MHNVHGYILYTYLIGIYDELFSLRMEVADEDEVTDVAAAHVEVSG